MEKKAILAVAVVAIVVAAGVGGYLVLAGDDGNSDKSSGDGAVMKTFDTNLTSRCFVYGNADNDDDFDSDDVEFIKSIVASSSWNSSKYPFADANCDNVVDQDDVEYAEKLLEGKTSMKMYYMDRYGSPIWCNYPLSGKSIGVTYDYGYMIAQVLGIWDDVSAATEKWLGVEESRYPGVSEFKSLGTSATGESVAASGVQIVMGSYNADLYSTLHDLPGEYDQINVIVSAVNDAGASPVAGILTLGVLFQKQENAQKYVAEYDKVYDYIADKIGELDESTFIMAYNTTSSASTKVDTSKATSLNTFGDVWTVSHLPMTDLMAGRGGSSAFFDVSFETIYATDPDYIIISMWDVIDSSDSAADGQNLFDEKAKYFENTRAYKNGNVFGIIYENAGTFLGPSVLPLLANYIWPDVYTDEQYGWDTLNSWIHEFTEISDDVDASQLGGMIVYKMSA